MNFVSTRAPRQRRGQGIKLFFMEKQELSLKAKKDWARELFIRNECNQKEIAAKVGVTPKTMSNWVNENDNAWEKMRKGLMATKATILKDLYDTLAAMKDEARTAATDGDPSTQPNTDGIYKLTLAIKKLETHAGIGEIIEALTLFIKFIQGDNNELAKQVTTYADLFINSILKSV